MTTARDYAIWTRRNALANRQAAKEERHARLVLFMDMCRDLEALGGRLGLLSSRTVTGLTVAHRRAEKAVEKLEELP